MSVDMDVYQYLLNYSDYKQGKKIAIAVSGGSDSIALLTMACESVGRENIIALTFDHRLREESTKEAEFVRDYCQKIGCKHQTLTLPKDKSLQATQKAAREMRYRYLRSYCIVENISYLLTAHHCDDQMETYYIRLLQNSELWGMAAIADDYNDGNIHILRPLLRMKSVELKDYLKQKDINWVEDPSNQNPKYLRSQIRHLRKENKLKDIELAPLQTYRQALTNIVNDWVAKHVLVKGIGCLLITKEAFILLSLELRLHILRLCLHYIGKGNYFLSLSKLEYIYDDLLSSDLFSAAGCLSFSDDDFIYIQHEYRSQKSRDIFCFDNCFTIFDNRFHIFHPKSRGVELIYVGDCTNNSSQQIDVLLQQSNKKKYRYIKALPIVIYEKNNIIYPEILQKTWSDGSIKLSLIDILGVSYCQKYFIDPSF
ncbi:MAG: tRNA lysidine(34) synthetase TilS [Alphaproteobacteria bacterium]